jgi:TusE/DsrC/DsvC family sulfur relay protein
MNSLTFGQFLLQEGLVSYDDLLKARILQKKSSKKLGDIAIRLGLLTDEQVERILIEQEESGITFGQIAIRENYLNAEQVDVLLSRQIDSCVNFYDALIAIGVMTPDVHALNMKKYEAFQAKSGHREGDPWFKIEFHGRVIEIDSEGFLRNKGDWSEALAVYIAEKENIDLNEQHWEIIHFIRQYHQDYHIAPMPKVIVKAINTLAGSNRYTIKSLCGLFHGSSIRKACQLAGIPKPPGCT